MPSSAVAVRPLRPALPRLRRRPPARGRLLGASRGGVVLLLLLALANGVFLFGVPAQAEPHYAWAIAPPINAAFLGAGYLAGTVATALVVFAARSWRSLRTLPLPLVVLAVALLAATGLHIDRFRLAYAPTWVWIAVYAGVPFVVGALWRRQERLAPAPPARDPRLRALRLESAALGTVLAVGAGALFVAPATVGEYWPWPLTPLLGQAVASWYALVATALLCCAWSLRRPVEAVIPYATLLTWSVLLLALPLLHAGDLDGPSGALAAWTAIQLALVALAVHALVLGVRAIRREGARL